MWSFMTQKREMANQDEAVPLEQLYPRYQTLVQRAIRAMGKAYCMYSNYAVGASLLGTDGTMTDGANWENCILQSVCAERCAIVSANVSGCRTAVAIAVAGGPRDPSIQSPRDGVCTPCGYCRQMLMEISQLSGYDMDVLLVTNDHKAVRIRKISTLLPFAFGPNDVRANFGEEYRSALTAQAFPFSPINEALLKGVLPSPTTTRESTSSSHMVTADVTAQNQRGQQPNACSNCQLEAGLAATTQLPCSVAVRETTNQTGADAERQLRSAATHILSLLGPPVTWSLETPDEWASAIVKSLFAVGGSFQTPTRQVGSFRPFAPSTSCGTRT